MCGIFVSISDDNGSAARQEKNHNSLDLLAHRGPDNSSFLNYGNIFLGHTRLEIIDHNPDSNQPFTSLCGRYAIVFNGEIYNHLELRAQYLQGWHFRTVSDTETVAELWSKYGQRCLNYLDGMFSIVVLDNFDSTITAARDMFGIKPLFSFFSEREIIFSSEIRPMLPYLSYLRENKEVISHYLYHGLYDHTEATFFDGIYSCRPGIASTYSLQEYRKLDEHAFFDIRGIQISTSTNFCPKDAKDELAALLQKCVDSSAIAEVPVGSNTSGGVDSSLLYCLLNGTLGNVPALNMSFPGTLDSSYIDNSSLDFDYRRVLVDVPDILGHMKDVVRHQTQPFGGLCVIAYSLLYSYASSLGIRVSLDANGLDEMFLGYAKYASSGLTKRNIHHDGTRLCLEGVLAAGMPSPDAIGYRPIAIPGLTNLRLEALNDLFFTKVPRALRFNDHVSMQHSVELRVPFLRKQLLEFSLRVPDDFLISNDIGKFPIRTILSQKTCNHSHAFATKASIQSPQTRWLDNELRGFVDAAVLKSGLFDRGWVNPEIVRDAISSRISVKQNNSFFIWQLINLELMAQAFLD